MTIYLPAYSGLECLSASLDRIDIKIMDASVKFTLP